MNEFSKSQRWKTVFNDLNIIILLIAALGVFIILSFSLERFLTPSNFQSMAFQIPEFGFLAIAMAICLISGGIDLSIVAIANLSNVIGGYIILGMVNNGGNAWLAIIIAFSITLIIATFLGLLNGFLVSKVHIFPILATLSTMIFYNGVTMAITEGTTVTGFPTQFSEISIFKLFGIPIFFILFIIGVLVISIILSKTYFGKSLYLYGENNVVALFSGMKVNAIIMKTYALSGFLSGVGGLIMVARVNSARVGYGDSYILQALLVCVLGGLSFAGGKGKIIGVFLGILVLQMLQSGFTLLGMEPYFKNFIWGIVLIGVMILNYYFENIRRKMSLNKSLSKNNV